MFEFKYKGTMIWHDANEKELRADRLEVSCKHTYACYILPLGSVCLRLCNRWRSMEENRVTKRLAIKCTS